MGVDAISDLSEERRGPSLSFLQVGLEGVKWFEVHFESGW